MNKNLTYLLAGSALLYSQGCEPIVEEEILPEPTPIVCEPSSEMTDFYAVNMPGEAAVLEDYLCDDKLVVLNFWETWCGPCIAEMPHLNQFAIDYFDDVTVLGLTRDQNGDTREFVEENNYNGINFLIVEQGTFLAYGITAIPTSFLLDEKGTMVLKHKGAMPFDETNELVQTIDYLLGQELD